MHLLFWFWQARFVLQPGQSRPAFGRISAYLSTLSSRTPVSDDFDDSPQSAIRRTEAFRVPAFRRETASQTDGAVVVVRRSQRLASRPIKASSTATKPQGRKKATQDVLEHLKCSTNGTWKSDDESISAAPFKIKKLETRKKVKRFFGVSDENAVSKGPGLVRKLMVHFEFSWCQIFCWSELKDRNVYRFVDPLLLL
ncbi:hypothetical protein BT96DRAFT_1000644 [Gymnopus androsaceus JB14]|uniref:Uncharacterized protein n=1 Tax=Gymnopus androsaceus JB14 TaxID=1447944 RepID=A0A6A4H1L9_9AGAR|nr:hypothetical protein BT96DRAFT_1000644 [Gymnopus androsaceus JB14]